VSFEPISRQLDYEGGETLKTFDYFFAKRIGQALPTAIKLINQALLILPYVSSGNIFQDVRTVRQALSKRTPNAHSRFITLGQFSSSLLRSFHFLLESHREAHRVLRDRGSQSKMLMNRTRFRWTASPQ